MTWNRVEQSLKNCYQVKRYHAAHTASLMWTAGRRFTASVHPLFTSVSTFIQMIKLFVVRLFVPVGISCVGATDLNR